MKKMVGNDQFLKDVIEMNKIKNLGENRENMMKRYSSGISQPVSKISENSNNEIVTTKQKEKEKKQDEKQEEKQ